MKKFIISAVAAGALTIGGAASAQDIGSVITNLLGMFLGDTTSSTTTQTQVYTDSWGRYYYMDQYGRQVYLQPAGYTDSYGRQVYRDQYGRQLALTAPTTTYGSTIVGYDSWGRPIYGNSGSTYSYGGQYPYSVYNGGQYAQGSSWDYDGDGIANSRDRWPNDPRYR